VGAGLAADAPEREGVAQSGQAVEEQAERGSGGDNPSDPSSAAIPVRIIKDRHEAKRDEAREAQSDKYEAEDLAVQQKAADSTAVAATAADRQVYAARLSVLLTLVATVIAGVGTWFLIATFRETRRTAEAAVKGMEAAERANAIAAAVPKEAVEAATEANRINREAHLADQRPWLSVSYAPHSGLEWTESHYLLDIAFILKIPARRPHLGPSWKSN
jgi:hypothetical protein